MNAIEYNATLPANINRIINDKGYKQGIIAERSGFSQKAFSDMLNGRKIIKVVDILKISSVLGVTPNEIFGISSGQ